MSDNLKVTFTLSGRQKELLNRACEPVSQGECCDHCNATVVIPARIMNIVEKDRDE